MRKSVKKEVFINQPIYTGGPKAMQLFIQNNLQYPEDAEKDKTEGVVVLRTTIDHQGNVTDASILSSVSPSCDQEAMRVARLLRFSVPKNPRNLKVLFHKNIKVQFRLPQQMVKNNMPPLEQKITYTVIAAPPQKAPEEEKGGNSSYTYTIKL